MTDLNVLLEKYKLQQASIESEIKTLDETPSMDDEDEAERGAWELALEIVNNIVTDLTELINTPRPE